MNLVDLSSHISSNSSNDSSDNKKEVAGGRKRVGANEIITGTIIPRRTSPD